MGQVMLPPDAAEALEALVPMDVIGLAEGRQRYALFTNDGRASSTT
jgi:aminomethyltransferase